MSDDLLHKLSFSICDLKTVIYFLKTTNVIKEFSQCVLLCDQIQKSMSNYDITINFKFVNTSFQKRLSYAYRMASEGIEEKAVKEILKETKRLEIA